MSNWQRITADPFGAIFGPVREVAGAARDATGVALNALTAVGAVLDTFVAIPTRQQDLAAQSLNGALAALRATLSDLDILETGADVNIHVLPVPLIAPYRQDLTKIVMPVRTLRDAALAFKLLKPYPEQTASGGTFGLYRAIVDSLYDVDDANRPDYDQDAYVGCAVFLYGAPTISDFINAATRASILFEAGSSTGPQTPVTGYQIPVPRELKVRESKPGQYDVRFAPRGVQFARGGVGVAVTIESTTIYRKYGTRITQDEDLAQYAVVTLDNNARSADIPVSELCYVCAAHTVLISELKPGGASVRLEPSYEYLSDQVRVAANTHTRRSTTGGRLPDWFMLGSISEVLPPISRVLAELTYVLDTALNATTASKSFLASLRAGLAARERALATWLLAIERALAPLTLLSDLPAGLYVTSFDGVGGNAALLEGLRSAFSSNNTTLPPFRTGEEYVGGYVVVVAGTAADPVKRTIATLSTLLGGGTVAAGPASAPYQPPAPTRPAVDVLFELQTEIDAAVERIRTLTELVAQDPQPTSTISDLFPDEDPCGE